MTGIFDSGIGGLTALYEIRKINPTADLCFYADRKHSPYGTKSEKELIRLVKEDIIKLKKAGAEDILMACCTASTVYEKLPENMRLAAFPIISSASIEAARLTYCGSVAVIATEATVKSGKFKSELEKLGVKKVLEIPAQMLVSLTEGGCRDGRVSQRERKIIEEILSPVKDSDTDTLILGCTHFGWLENTICSSLGGIRVVNSSRAGAREIAKRLPPYGKGRTVYIN